MYIHTLWLEQRDALLTYSVQYNTPYYYSQYLPRLRGNIDGGTKDTTSCGVLCMYTLIFLNTVTHPFFFILFNAHNILAATFPSFFFCVCLTQHQDNASMPTPIGSSGRLSVNTLIEHCLVKILLAWTRSALFRTLSIQPWRLGH